MKRALLVGLVAIFGFTLLGCTPAPGTPGDDGEAGTGTANGETVKIGVLLPLSGPAVTYGSDILQGVETVQEEVNDAGGVNGNEIELIIEDGKCTGKDATSAVQKLINIDNVVAIIGGACSSETIPAGRIAQQSGVPMISPTASSPEISTIGEYIFRYYNDADAGKRMLEYIDEIEAEGIGIVYESTDYAASYAEVVREGFNGEVVVDTQFLTDEQDFSIIAKEVASNIEDIDALVFVPQTEANAVPFIRSLDDEGVWDELRERLIGTESVITETVLNQLGELANGMKGVRFPQVDAFGEETVEQTERLVEGYEVQTSEVFVLFGADAFDMVVSAIEETGADSDAIQNYLAAIDEDNKRNAYVPGFYFDQEGDGQGIPFVLVEISDGEIVNVD